MRRILFSLLGFCLLFGCSAFAQDGNTQMYFNGGYQGSDWAGGPEGDVATGFYNGSINGTNVGPGQTSPGMICDDYYDNVFSGEHWTATAYQVSTLNAGNIGQDTLFGSAAGWRICLWYLGPSGIFSIGVPGKRHVYQWCRKLRPTVLNLAGTLVSHFGCRRARVQFSFAGQPGPELSYGCAGAQQHFTEYLFRPLALHSTL